MTDVLTSSITKTAFAFRGYNVTNLGRSRELLLHPAYGASVADRLREASAICSDAVGRRVDLIDRIRRGEETTLENYDEAIGLIVTMELVQIDLLRSFFGLPLAGARMAYGYSLGEISALVAGGVMDLDEALPIPLAMAADCAALAGDVRMGVVFSRGLALDVDAVRRLCLQVNTDGRGVVGISSILSPNTLLVLGQGDSVERFRKRMHHLLPDSVHLHFNPHRWPPMHTPILWQRNIPNRASVMMQTIKGGFQAPLPRVFSLATGAASYNDYNCREILAQWIDHPQRLWDAVYATLAEDIETVVHVGPEPNLIPATFDRLAKNVQVQLAGRTIGGLSLRAVSGIAGRAWLRALLPSRAALLRAPRIKQIVLEDWLLEQKVP